MYDKGVPSLLLAVFDEKSRHHLLELTCPFGSKRTGKAREKSMEMSAHSSLRGREAI